MTIINRDGVFLLGVVDGVTTYTAWSRRADPMWLADQAEALSTGPAVPSTHAGPAAGGGASSPPVQTTPVRLAAIGRIRRRRWTWPWSRR